MARTSDSLPKRFPVGTRYVVESRGSGVRRYVEFPNGHKVILAKRRALPCTDAETRHRSTDRTHSKKLGDQPERLRAPPVS
jgi:hypothetical protein